MRPDIKAALVKIVRDCELPVGSGALRSAEPERYCLLGIVCELYRRQTELGEWVICDDKKTYSFALGQTRRSALAPLKVEEWAGLNTYESCFMVRTSDEKPLRGPALADYIEREIPETT